MMPKRWSSTNCKLLSARANSINEHIQQHNKRIGERTEIERKMSVEDEEKNQTDA
jgi:ribosomal protein S15P/S13E